MPKMYRDQIYGENLIIYFLNQDAPLVNEIQLLPYGQVSSKKGKFLVDEQAVAEIFKAYNAQKNDIVIDYEHQTLEGVQAPAAGWIKELIDRGKDGIWAKVEWTAKAAEYIKNKEYRYLSPVILVRKSDSRVVYIHSAALTNTPAIDGMHPIANKLGYTLETEDEQMEFLKKLALKLGLKETATEDEVIQAVENLQQSFQVAANKAVLDLLGLKETATEEEVKGKITALKNSVTEVANKTKEILSLLDLKEGATLEEIKGAIIALKNPSGYVRVEDFKALKDKLELKERDELVNYALNTGKITPAQKKWAEEQALKDPAGFKAFLDTAPRVVPLDKLPGGDPPAKDPVVNDEVQLSVNKMLGLSEEDFKKYNS